MARIFRKQIFSDPTLFVTAHKSKRFYLFTQRELDGEAYERDIFNEKPTKEETMAAAQVRFLFILLLIIFKRPHKREDWQQKSVCELQWEIFTLNFSKTKVIFFAEEVA